MNQWVVLSDIRLEIDDRFKKEKITIPFPQRTLWIKEKNHSPLSTKDEKNKKG